MLLHQTSGSPVFINLHPHLLCCIFKNPGKPIQPTSFSSLFKSHPPPFPTHQGNITHHHPQPKLSNAKAFQFLVLVSPPNFLKQFSSSFLLFFSYSMATMKPRFPNYLNLKLLLLGFVLLFLILLFLRSGSSSPAPPSTSESSQISPSNALATTACTKIPQSLANTIIHYATSNTTPQQTFKEISVTARVLEKKAPCNFLVFGLGHDSPMWSALNHGGRTVFLEEDMSWMETIQQKFPTLESYHATYDTKVTQADDLLELRRRPECTVVGDMKFSKCQLALKRLPSVFFEVEWDLIMVDAPTGWIPEAPGRMGAIYSAGMAARARRQGETDVFVHDVDRVVEDKFSKTFLCEGYLTEQEGRLRHFTIPSHRTGLEVMPFCP